MEHLGKALYAYCTDFIINMGNLFNLSYYEVNALLFCVAYPALVMGLTVLYFVQRRRLRKVKE